VARQVIGTTVIGGMLAATAIGIFFIAAGFYLVEKVSFAARAPGPSPGILPSPGHGD
jgi:HAE1 family hydrophobic/amphiphilic exporter-1